ncbi:MAG: hypothetical protein Q8Q85_13640 [Gemmatimonadales bacterium]|nr:hypothetical protein [Gemmatimonadales bacterium]
MFIAYVPGVAGWGTICTAKRGSAGGRGSESATRISGFVRSVTSRGQGYTSRAMPRLSPRGEYCAWCIPRTASAFAEHVLAEEDGAVSVLGQHTPAMARLREADPPRARWHLGTIRDPVEWYGSLWAHATRARRGPGTVARVRAALDRLAPGIEDFPAFLRAATQLPANYAGGFVLELPVYDPPPLGARGLWSWTVRYMLTDWITGDWLVQGFLRAESTERDLGMLLGHPVDRVRYPPRNGSDRGDVTTPEMRGWVAEADGKLAATLGYASRNTR